MSREKVSRSSNQNATKKKEEKVYEKRENFGRKKKEIENEKELKEEKAEKEKKKVRELGTCKILEYI